MQLNNESKRRVQQQFSDKAPAYATSAVHVDPASLSRLVEMVAPHSDWVVLDIGTGPGHTAHAFAPFVRGVVASDLTAQMLPMARALATERGLTNVVTTAADAEALPFTSGSFDLVTCRLAAHHFPHLERFMEEAARVLRPAGVLAVVDNIVPGSRLRGRKGRLPRQAGDYVNAFERLRDPSHARCLSLYEWQDTFAAAGFAILQQETSAKPLDFYDYVARMNVPAQDVTRLEVMLTQAPREVLEFLTPKIRAGTIEFCLSEALLVGKLEQ